MGIDRTCCRAGPSCPEIIRPRIKPPAIHPHETLDHPPASFLRPAAQAQVFTPKDINLNVSFDNTNPAVTALMGAPGGPGLHRVFVTATTDPVPPGGVRQAVKDYDATGPLSAATVFSVYADLGGIDPAVGKYRKKYTISNFEVATLPADTVQTINVTIDTAADGFFEIHAPTPAPNDGRPDYPVLLTTFNSGDGYGNWERHKSFTGTNFTEEASGPFTAANLLATPPPGQGFYSVYGETFLRIPTGAPGVHRLQFLSTPALGSGSNAAPAISNTDLDTGDTFVIKPGYLTGSLQLSGPPALPGQPALLAHILRSTDGDTDSDGQNNRFEFIAGINPMDPISRFILSIEPVPNEPNKKQLKFSPVFPDRNYTVKSNASLAGAWQDLVLHSDDNGIPVRTIIDEAASEPGKFYHVEITKP